MTISIPTWFKLVLLVLSLNVTNWSNLEKKMSTFVILIFIDNEIDSWAAVKIILLIRTQVF